jgi:hypothetical protein
MAQTHEQLSLTQCPNVSESGTYDAGWLATCRCGKDIFPAGGRAATKTRTQQLMDTHLAEHGVSPNPFALR